MNAFDTINADVLEDAYSMQDFVYFDVETIPCQDPAYLERLKTEVSPPGNIKKQESIDAWLAENRESAALEAMSKTSFDGGRGHVCAISWAVNDGSFETVSVKDIAGEYAAIQKFFEAVGGLHQLTLVGHNIAGFDLPFLTKRAVSLGLALPPRRVWPRDVKPWSKEIADTMSMWAGGTNRISLDRLCDILGIPGKDGFDGSMVAEAWKRGEHEKIADYCRDDVWRVREIHKRFLAARF